MLINPHHRYTVEWKSPGPDGWTPIDTVADLCEYNRMVLQYRAVFDSHKFRYVTNPEWTEWNKQHGRKRKVVRRK